MHQIKFYPVGNGDTSQIILESGKRILFDFRHLQKAENEENPEINLKEHLRDELKQAKKDHFDIVAFTHGDKDHIENSTSFFELLHTEKYQGDDRISIKELWVPAAMIVETATRKEQSSEFVIWRQEARYRLKEGKGIRVFSKPDKLKGWLQENGLTVESRKHLITDAGRTVPGLTLADDGIEFFCHSPFIKQVDDNEDMRNEAALVFNIRLKSNSQTYDYLAIGDSQWEVLEDIVSISKKHGNEDRLRWDLFNIPHHCSYLALSDEKGEKETVPKEIIKELLEAGQENCYMVSSSAPIKDDTAAYEQKLPPHIQAAKCYRRHLSNNNGAKFLITMEEPTEEKPQPIIFEIREDGITLAKKQNKMASSIIIKDPAPRAGRWQQSTSQ